jgi:hypothetical protein
MTKRFIAAFLFATSLLAAQDLRAQHTSVAGRVEFAATYSASRSNVTDGSSFWAQGGSAEVGIDLVHHFSVVGNLNGVHSGNAATSNAPFSLITYTFGPRYAWSLSHIQKKHPSDLFAQALFGGAHEFDARLPNAATSASGFALQIGGGVDFGITHSFAVRGIEADWVRTQLPNAASGSQNSLRLSTGLVLRF